MEQKVRNLFLLKISFLKYNTSNLTLDILCFLAQMALSVKGVSSIENEVFDKFDAIWWPIYAL